ncbi:lantibiotic export protein [Streptococcus pneumoniae]|nr:lantibiotic export protein [Streptococcus pneumoniae]
MMTRKVPNIEQMSQIECGLCCCLSILHFYKSKETLLDLRRDIEKGRDGYSIGDLKQLLNKRNFDTGSYQVKDVNKISELPLPLIAFWDNQHYVVIYKVKKNKVYIMDPSKGYINYEFKEFSKHFSNIVLLSFPNENYQSLKSQFPSPWIRVFSSFSKVKGRLILTLLFSIISYLIILSVPVMTSKFINSALGNTFSFQTSFLILFSLLCLYLISILARSMGILFSNIFFSRDIESFTFKHLLKLPYSFFELRAKGDILYRISSLSGFRELFTNQVVGGVVDIGTILSVVIYMFLSSKTLSIIALILSLINFLFLFSTRKIMYDTVNRELQEQSLIYSVETEALNTISSIKISGLEDEIYENWSKYLKNVLTKYKKRSIVHILYNSATNVFQLFAPIIILIFGLDNVLNGKILLGEVVAFQTMASILFSSEISIFNAYTQYILAAGYLNRVNDIWLENEENVENGLKKCSLEGRIDIKDLSFSYSKDSAPVIENLNLTIEPGQRIALVGQSGSGKSTLSKILSGLYKIDTGKILFDGVNINQIDKKILSQNLGVVPQDSFLLNRSILDNITLKNEVTSQKIEEVCKAVQIYDEIMAMPMKFNTIISEMGSNISGGQRQRIALARALINNPSIVILDEATSALSKILSGLYKIDTGKVLFDGVNINQIDKKILSQNLGVVPQDSFLLNRSILDNITLKHDVTSQKIEEVCKAVQIYDEIMAMPMKFNTIISEMGSNISGGQRQRIALARALINNPSIVILDEATSALDTINEERITKYIQSQGCTQIIIAHRLSTIKDADIIFVMKGGKIVESGNHKYLMDLGGEYYSLYTKRK